MKNCRYISAMVLLVSFNSELWAQTFTDQAEEQGVNIFDPNYLYGSGMSFYDFDQDGWDDLTIGQVDSDPLFFRNNEGAFEAIDLGISNFGEIKQIIWVDIDNDGDMDLFIGKFLSASRLYRNDGELAFTDITATSGFPISNENMTWGVSWGDFNNDGFLDAYWANFNDGPLDGSISNMLFQNNGDATFTDVTSSSQTDNGTVKSFQPIWYDIDQDGDQDIHLINDRTDYHNAVYENQGDGTFIEIGEELGLGDAFDAMSNTLVDFDRDGDLDISISNSQEGNRLYKRLEDGTYIDVALDLGLGVHRICWATKWIDFENDGWLDEYVVTAYGSQDTSQNFAFSNFEAQFTQNLQGGFADDKSEAFVIVSGDVNNDGFSDMFVAAEPGDYPSRLWVNDATSTNNYLKVSLEGVVSNRDGVGSWIRAYVGDTVHVRYTLCGEDFLGQDSQREIIGVGANESIDSLEISWLSGHIDTFYEVETNQTLHIVEGSSLYDEPQTFYVDLCPSESVIIDAGEFYDVTWNTGEEQSSLLVDSGGTYFASILTENGIPIPSDTTIVSINFAPELSTLLDEINCLAVENDTLWVSAGTDFCIDLEATSFGGFELDLSSNITDIWPETEQTVISGNPLTWSSCASGEFGVGGTYLIELTATVSECSDQTSTLPIIVIVSESSGCTDTNACNFNPAALADDGSCHYPDVCGDCCGSGIYGCNDPLACNWSPEATCGGESCIYSSPPNPATVSIDDILDLLAEWGNIGSCGFDLDQDGVVTAYDLIALLSMF